MLDIIASEDLNYFLKDTVRLISKKKKGGGKKKKKKKKKSPLFSKIL